MMLTVLLVLKSKEEVERPVILTISDLWVRIQDTVGRGNPNAMQVRRTADGVEIVIVTLGVRVTLGKTAEQNKT